MSIKNLKTSLLISSQEKALIKKQYKKLCKLIKIEEKNRESDLNAAFQVSYEQHQHIRRKSGEPYVLHPINVALILVEELGITEIETIICALLHDVVEDTPITLEEIRERFGDRVALILDALTKIKEPLHPHEPTASMQAMNFKKLFCYFAKDMRICAIKIADRLDNMRSLQFLPKDKQLKIAHETKEFYAPLAHRLGVGGIKSSLEDLYLKYVEPEAYKMVTKNIQLHRRGKSKTIQDFAVPVIQVLNEKKIKYRVETRLKSIYSIYSKMMRKQIGFDKIHDICGLRIIIDYPKEEEIKKCWEVYAIITGLYHINPERTRDWISIPRSNGYESLHMTAMSKKGEWVEVQIRSERMHRIATHGIAAHWKYKEGNDKWYTGDNVNYQQLIEQMGDLANQDIDVSQAIRDARLALYEKDMCIFTNAGERISLPRESTVFDFAIETMHEKGAYCTHALVDGEKQGKEYVLKNGQQVNTIFLNPNQKLKPEWTLLTNTPKTRKIWKQVFSAFGKKQKNSGKKKVKKLFTQYGIDLSNVIEKELKYFFKQNTIENLYYKLGEGSIPIPLVEEFIEEKVKNLQQHSSKSTTDSQPKRLFLRGSKSDIYELSPCCGPVTGDKLLAAAMPAKSMIEVHRADCPEAANISAQNAHNIISVSWQHTDYLFTRSIIFKGIISRENKRKIIGAIQNFDITSFSLEKKDDTHSIGTIILNVQNAHELNNLMSEIKKIAGIIEVKRGRVTN